MGGSGGTPYLGQIMRLTPQLAGSIEEAVENAKRIAKSDSRQNEELNRLRNYLLSKN